MPTRALFLSKDEKALDAVTQVLSDLEVSFESFQEPSVALKRVASHHFDMILVDCDNEQNATQVLTGAKNSSVNQNTISIAIVDAKNGVANAFRLGASLVLSKPISIEQARGTLRNALAMVKKASPEIKTTTHAPSQSATMPPVTAPAISSAPASSPLKPAPVQAVKPVAESIHASVAPTPGFKTPELPLKKPSPSLSLGSTEGLHFAEEGSKTPKTKGLSLMGDDLPLSGSSRHPAPPMFGMSAEKEKQRKTSPFLLAAVAAALIAAGVYGYSMVNPGFHSVLSSQFKDVQVMVGLAPKPQAVAVVPQPAPAQPAAPASQPPSATPGVATPNEAATANSQPADGFAQPSQAAPSQGFASSAAPQKSSTPVILSTSATTVQKPAVENEPLSVPEDVADSHVTYRVQPAYPEAARKKGVKGSVILNTSIDQDGNVTAVGVVSGNAQLASAAVAAVKQWRYETYYHNGQATEFQTQVTVRFPQPATR